MSDTPDTPTPDPTGTPGKPGSDPNAELIDAVVGDTPAPAEPEPADPSPAEPASAGDSPTNGPTPADDTPDAAPENNDKTKSEKDKPEPTTAMGKLWHSWIKPIGAVFLIVAVVRSTLIDWNDVPSGSMEPTILVGDRILVNKMAYALQFPLSGPKIGVPFTALQWDNPLDGLPSWQWGKPVRGDIVTFWNPATGVRMVKRIVAQPGDTLELRGGVMTVTPEGGTPTTATYNDTTPFPANLTIVGKDQHGNEVTNATRDFEENLLGESREIQHIRLRWVYNWGMARVREGVLPEGHREVAVIDGVVALGQEGQLLQVQSIQTEDGLVLRIQGTGIPLERLNTIAGSPVELFTIKDGTPYLNGDVVSFKTFVAAYLKPIADSGPIDFDGVEIGASGHGWTMDGEAAYIEAINIYFYEKHFSRTQAQPTARDTAAAQKDLLTRFNLVRQLMHSSFGPVVLGDEEYYMIGDNRNNSTDSRYFGPVRRSEITGQAIAIPASFHGRIRDLKPNWSRWFSGLD